MAPPSSLRDLIKALGEATQTRAQFVRLFGHLAIKMGKELQKVAKKQGLANAEAETLIEQAGWQEMMQQINPTLQSFISEEPFVFAETEAETDIPLGPGRTGNLLKHARFASAHAVRQMNRIRSGLAESINAGITVAKELGEARSQFQVLRDATRKMKGQVESIMDTSMSGLQSDVQKEVGGTYWLYLGPDDDKVIRPFCDVLAGLAIPEKLVNKLNNNQGLPVSRYLGGYNCRHSWVVVSATYVKQNNIPIATMDHIRRANRSARSRRAA